MNILGQLFIQFLKGFNRKVWIKMEILFKTTQFWDVRKVSHLPRLNGHSPHVASGEWVGQRWSNWNKRVHFNSIFVEIRVSIDVDIVGPNMTKNRKIKALFCELQLQYLPLNKITLGQIKVITLTDWSNWPMYFVYCLGIMRPAMSDYIKRRHCSFNWFEPYFYIFIGSRIIRIFEKVARNE